jgi:hypothetical protein
VNDTKTVAEALRTRAKALLDVANDLEKLDQFLLQRPRAQQPAAPRKPLSNAGRAKIRAALKARWAKVKSEAKPQAIAKARPKVVPKVKARPPAKHVVDPLLERA